MKMTEYYSEALDERYYRLKHKSGLDIYVFPKDRTVTYALFATKYGSIDNRFRTDGGEVSVPDGIAHYLEHRMFTQADGSDITERFSECGAYSNAYTSFTKTAYLFSCTENFEEALAALLDFVTEPHFTEELVEKERGIIIQEIKMGEDDPYDRCYFGLLGALYQKNSVRIDVAGSVESVKKITAEMLNTCYNAFYTPNNMALVVCGNVSIETVARVADANLPETYVPKTVERIYEEEPREIATPRKECYMNVGKPIYSIGIKDVEFAGTAKERLKREVTMMLLCEILFSRAGAFYNYLFEENIIGSDFYYDYSIFETFGFVNISGEADDPDRLLEEIKRYIRETKEQGLDREDFERCYRLSLSDYIKEFDSTGEIANNFLDTLFDGNDLFAYGEAIKNVTYDDVTALLESAFDEDLFAMSVVYPEESREENQNG